MSNKPQVRAKFQVSSKESRLSYGGAEEVVVKMRPVTSGSEENRAFYAATPTGNIDLGTVNRQAAAYFEFGKEYYVTLPEAK
jgi:hypothetical protein